MHAQYDIDDNKYLLIETFVNDRKDDWAHIEEDQKVVAKGRETIRKSAAGWDICCEWKGGSTSWKKLSNLKELYPIQVA